jgi:flagellar protein FliS
MVPNNSYNQYRQVQVSTASQGSLILMIYDGITKRLNVASAALKSKQLEVANKELQGAQNLITELMLTLNFDAGGDIAKNLYRLYEYFNYRLVQANIKKDPEIVQEIIDHVVDLRKTWQQVIRQAGAGSTVTQKR